MRQVKGKTRLIMYAGVSKPSPKLGQTLGPMGMNMMQFCKEINDKTNHFSPDVPMRVILTAYTDRTYEYKIKPPPSTWFFKRLADQVYGITEPGTQYVATVGVKYLYELAKVFKEFNPDMKNYSLFGIVRSFILNCENMGFKVVKDRVPPKNITPKKFF